ncbi:hypothetical protein [Pseudomonas sp. R1-15]|uniref:hypothetical protein n=1 Tax=Pseudomonas sp. R1-15 TaxID=2817399 RepID=UPI003DA7D217
MSQVKERPILFSAPMVRAILEDRKRVTRRPVKGGQIPTEDTSVAAGERHRWMAIAQRDPRYGFGVFGATEAECAKELEECALCPYGKPGDRLWVRETTEADYANGAVLSRYAADGEPVLHSGCGDPEYNGSVAHWDYPRKSRPSIHMQRWASRILLEITAVRVERLQDISDEQAKAEGIIPHVRGGWHWHPHNPSDVDDWHQFGFKTPVWAFHDLWVGINGQKNWDANPWVWVV